MTTFFVALFLWSAVMAVVMTIFCIGSLANDFIRLRRMKKLLAAGYRPVLDKETPHVE